MGVREDFQASAIRSETENPSVACAGVNQAIGSARNIFRSLVFPQVHRPGPLQDIVGVEGHDQAFIDGCFPCDGVDRNRPQEQVGGQQRRESKEAGKYSPTTSPILRYDLFYCGLDHKAVLGPDEVAL